MNTITTKQLRENMPQVIKDLQAGDSIKLSYRHAVIATLRPVASHAIALRRGSTAAVQDFLRTADFGPIPRSLQISNKSFKEQIADLRASASR